MNKKYTDNSKTTTNTINNSIVILDGSQDTTCDCCNRVIHECQMHTHPERSRGCVLKSMPFGLNQVTLEKRLALKSKPFSKE